MYNFVRRGEGEGVLISLICTIYTEVKLKPGDGGDGGFIVGEGMGVR